jgi:hypothetical protein
MYNKKAQIELTLLVMSQPSLLTSREVKIGNMATPLSRLQVGLRAMPLKAHYLVN